jgi:hypothetical protein
VKAPSLNPSTGKKKKKKEEEKKKEPGRHAESREGHLQKVQSPLSSDIVYQNFKVWMVGQAEGFQDDSEMGSCPVTTP